MQADRRYSRNHPSTAANIFAPDHYEDEEQRMHLSATIQKLPSGRAPYAVAATYGAFVPDLVLKGPDGEPTHLVGRARTLLTIPGTMESGLLSRLGIEQTDDHDMLAYSSELYAHHSAGTRLDGRDYATYLTYWPDDIEPHRHRFPSQQPAEQASGTVQPTSGRIARFAKNYSSLANIPETAALEAICALTNAVHEDVKRYGLGTAFEAAYDAVDRSKRSGQP